MIVFGISESARQGESVGRRCEHCGGSIQRSVKWFRYFHLFWLPVIPLGARIGVVCDHCQRTRVNGDIPGPERDRVKQANREVRRPLWHYLGSLLVAALIWNGVAADNRLERLASSAAAQPQVGDVWVVDVKAAFPEMDAPYRFGTARVVELDDSGVELAFSDWYYGFSSTARDEARTAAIEHDADYFTAPVWFSAEQMVELQSRSELRFVEL